MDVVDVWILVFQNYFANTEFNSLLAVIQKIVYVTGLVKQMIANSIHTDVHGLGHIELLLFEQIGVFLSDAETNLIHLDDYVEKAHPLIHFSSGSRMQLETSLHEIDFESAWPIRLFRSLI